MRWGGWGEVSKPNTFDGLNAGGLDKPFVYPGYPRFLLATPSPPV